MKRSIFGCVSVVACAGVVWSVRAQPGPATTPPSANHGAQQATRYFCPMKCEGEKTYDAPGKCPVCHMNLKPVAMGPALEVQPAGELKSGEPQTLTLTIRGGAGAASEVLDSAMADVVFVARDLSWFARQQPRQLEHGSTQATQTFSPGEYRVFVNASPTKGDAVQAAATLSVYGKTPVPKAMGVDAERAKVVNGLTVSLEGYQHLRAGEGATLTFHLSRDGKPASDLKARSGGTADHLTAISQDLGQCVHAQAAQGSAASDPSFAVRLDRPGLYRIWGEFADSEKSVLVPFVVEVSEAGGK